MKFDCSSPSTCIETDWRPLSSRGNSNSPPTVPAVSQSVSSASGGMGGSTAARQAADLAAIRAYNGLSSTSTDGLSMALSENTPTVLPYQAFQPVGSGSSHPSIQANGLDQLGSMISSYVSSLDHGASTEPATSTTSANTSGSSFTTTGGFLGAVLRMSVVGKVLTIVTAMTILIVVRILVMLL